VTEQSQKTATTTEIPVENSASDHVSAVSNYRKMMAMPALKILADLDHSEKSFDVLRILVVMDRCWRQPNNLSVFIGCGDDDKERNLAFGKICIYFLWLYYLLNIPSSLFSLHKMVPK
jgi:hypothetical protein